MWPRARVPSRPGEGQYGLKTFMRFCGRINMRGLHEYAAEGYANIRLTCMPDAEIHEKLARVVVRYEGGKIDPLELRWKTRDLRVRSVNARWVDRATRPWRYFFSVSTSTGEVLILSWREGEGLWYLEAVKS
jgi:hypothetical protein